MRKFSSFEAYIEFNYAKYFAQEVKTFILEKHKKNKCKEKIYHFDDCIIEGKDISIMKIIYTKSHLNRLEFIVNFYADYTLSDSSTQYLLYRRDLFALSMEGSLENGFKPKKEEIELNQDDIPERLTNGLVPIICNKDLDKYATKFLRYYCKEALEKPTRLDISKILADNGMSFYFAPLSMEELGKIYFAEDKALVYDDVDGKPYKINVKPGTILINFTQALQRGNGSIRNTLIHELVHWFFHRNYFLLRQYLDNDKTCMICYKAENRYDNNDIRWMEAQARRLAPRILMPKKQALVKLKELIKVVKETALIEQWNVKTILEEIVKKFADFFGVSLISAKIRIKELGYTEFDGVLNYTKDGTKLKNYLVLPNILMESQSFIIDEKMLNKLIEENYQIKTAIDNERLVYTNNMLIANNPRYIQNKEITEYVTIHPEECALIFTTIPDVDMTQDKDGKILYLASSSGNKNNRIDIDSAQFNKVIALADVNYIHFQEHKKYIPDDLAGTLKYHYEKCKENKIFF